MLKFSRKNKLKHIKPILKELNDKLSTIYGDRLKRIIVFGSWARGNPTEDSDIDIALIFKNNISPGKEIDKIIDVITELNLKYDVLISIYPVSEEKYLNVNSPLLLNIKNEGITV